MGLGLIPNVEKNESIKSEKVGCWSCWQLSCLCWKWSLCREAEPGVCMCVLVAQLCLTLCNSMDCSPPGSSVHGILLARILEWAATSSSRGSSQPRNQTCVSYTGRQIPYHYHSLPPGKPGAGKLNHAYDGTSHTCQVMTIVLDEISSDSGFLLA